MKRNMDCFNDVLRHVENHHSYECDVPGPFKDYSGDQIRHHVNLALGLGYLILARDKLRLTWEGHGYLDNLV